MSLDICLRSSGACPTCKREAFEPQGLPDPTWNLSPIFHLALTGVSYRQVEGAPFEQLKDGLPWGLRLLDGREAKTTIAELTLARDRMADAGLRRAFLALEPSNGWGDFGGARGVVSELLEAAIEHPENIWEVR